MCSAQSIRLHSYSILFITYHSLFFWADWGLNNPAINGGVSVITSLLVSNDREAAAYVQSLGLKAVAVV